MRVSNWSSSRDSAASTASPCQMRGEHEGAPRPRRCHRSCGIRDRADDGLSGCALPRRRPGGLRAKRCIKCCGRWRTKSQRRCEKHTSGAWAKSLGGNLGELFNVDLIIRTWRSPRREIPAMRRCTAGSNTSQCLLFRLKKDKDVHALLSLGVKSKRCGKWLLAQKWSWSWDALPTVRAISRKLRAAG